MNLFILFITSSQIFVSQDVTRWTEIVCIVMVFISCLDSFWRHPFTAEDPLVSKWFNATFFKRETSLRDKLNYIFVGLRVSKLIIYSIFINLQHFIEFI